MPVSAPAYTTINPHYMEPQIIMPMVQASGAFKLIADGKPRIRIDDDTQAVYINRLDLRTEVSSGMAPYNVLAESNATFSQISTPAYRIRSRAEFDHHEATAVGRYGTSINELNRLANRQAHFQMQRNCLLYGYNPQYGEGLLNTNGATNAPLPPDSNGNQTLVTYDNGQLGIWFLSQFTSLLSRTQQSGIPHHFTICGPQRVLDTMSLQNIVQLTSYQRPGAGVATTVGLVNNVMSDLGHTVYWVFDDTLIGKGQGGADAILMTMPEVAMPEVGEGPNTNEFAKLMPNLPESILMYADMPAPKEIPTPIPDGGINILYEMKITSGWPVRPECVTIMSIPYQ